MTSVFSWSCATSVSSGFSWSGLASSWSSALSSSFSTESSVSSASASSKSAFSSLSTGSSGSGELSSSACSWLAWLFAFTDWIKAFATFSNSAGVISAMLRWPIKFAPPLFKIWLIIWVFKFSWTWGSFEDLYIPSKVLTSWPGSSWAETWFIAPPRARLPAAIPKVKAVLNLKLCICDSFTVHPLPFPHNHNLIQVKYTNYKDN